MNDTICAIATTLGVGAISIIRVSGNQAVSIVDKIFSNDLKNKDSHTITYGYIKDKKEVIDEVLVSVMKSPKTFTTEDVVEINCHGGIATTKKVLEFLLKNGCRLAEPGEFTKRAFLNGRIDLTEAQAVMDLVSTKSESARIIAINNLKGETKNKIQSLRNIILDLISNIEVNIDYSEYLDIEEVTKEKLKTTLTKTEEELTKIIENSKNSRMINNGINVSIVGKPNVGKSSILNKLLKEDKAIVTDIPGTTRDIVEGSIIIDNVLFNFSDTAGIRETENIVEKIGVSKSLDTLDKSDLILVVLDSSKNLTEDDKKILFKTKDKKRIIVANKDDLKNNLAIKEDVIYINALTEEGINPLKEAIKENFNFSKIKIKDFNYVNDFNSIKILEEAKQTLNVIKKEMQKGTAIDILEIDLKNIWVNLGKIIGETYTEEFLDHLFSNFCVGK